MGFLSPVEGGLSFRIGYGELKIIGLGGAKKFLIWGVGVRIPFHVMKYFGNSRCSYPVIFSRTCYLLLAKYINALFLIRSITLSLNLLLLNFLQFLVLDVFKLLIIFLEELLQSKANKNLGFYT